MLTVLSLLSLAQLPFPVPTASAPVATPSSPTATPALTTPVLPTLDAPLPAPPVSHPLNVVQSQEVRPLPGQLDDIPVFNSNSPELIQKEGILLSTFPSEGMRTPSAHLNYPLEGRFDLFAHHVARGLTPDDNRTLYVGILVYNPGNEPVKLDILQGVSYLSQDAPFHDLPSYVANPIGNVYAGPGSRTTNDVLRGERQPHWPSHVTIPSKGYHLLANVPIPLRRLTVATNGTLPPGSIIPAPIVASNSTNSAQTHSARPTSGQTATTQAAAVLLGGLTGQGAAVASPIRSELNQTPAPGSNSATPGTAAPNSTLPSAPPPVDNRPLPSNGRSLLMHLSTDGPVYVASLAMYARPVAGGERVPTLAEWEQVLTDGELSGPRDRTPTSPNNARFVGRFFYGRVAGVAQGSQWNARVTDNAEVDYLSIPEPGQAFSYALSTVDRNTFGTGQIQSAPMLVRYSDTAYRAHGNYGVLYNITLPLRNRTDSAQRIAISLQTPLQDERLKGEGLRFRDPPYDQIFFRGTVRLRYTDDLGIPQTRYFHVVQRRGQQGEPLLRLRLPKGDRRLVEVQFIYPPDATPPQVLTVETVEERRVVEIENPGNSPNASSQNSNSQSSNPQNPNPAPQ